MTVLRTVARYTSPLLAVCASASLFAAPDLPAAEPGIRPLDLSLDENAADMDSRVPAQVISPIFRTYIEPLSTGLNRAPLHTDPTEQANELLARQLQQQARAASANSTFCLNKAAGDATGGGVRWSINEGFGFYVQGKGFRQLQRLLKHNDITGICPPGDPSPMCKTMPKRVCN